MTSRHGSSTGFLLLCAAPQVSFREYAIVVLTSGRLGEGGQRRCKPSRPKPGHPRPALPRLWVKCSPRKLKWIQNYTVLAMPNPALNQSARQKNVANMLATLRIEKLSPSESLKPSLQAYVDGQKTTTDLLNEVKAKYVALRRG